MTPKNLRCRYCNEKLDNILGIYFHLCKKYRNHRNKWNSSIAEGNIGNNGSRKHKLSNFEIRLERKAILERNKHRDIIRLNKMMKDEFG